MLPPGGSATDSDLTSRAGNGTWESPAGSVINRAPGAVQVRLAGGAITGTASLHAGPSPWAFTALTL